MTKVFLFCTAVIAAMPSFCQKPAIDTSVFSNWPHVDNAKISSDGKYVSYSTRFLHGDSLIFSSTNMNWKGGFSYAADANFLSDNKHAVFKTTRDSLWLLQLGTNRREFIGRATFYDLFKDKSNHEWLA